METPAPKVWQEAKDKIKKSGLKIDVFNKDFVGKLVAVNKEFDEYMVMFNNRSKVDPFKLDGKRLTTRSNVQLVAGVGATYMTLINTMKSKATPAQKTVLGTADNALRSLVTILNKRALYLKDPVGTVKHDKETHDDKGEESTERSASASGQAK